jgi:hypothetical protein
MKLSKLIKEQGEVVTPEFIKKANAAFKSQWGIDLKLSPDKLLSKTGRNIQYETYPKLTKIHPLVDLVFESIEAEAHISLNQDPFQLSATIHLIVNAMGGRRESRTLSTEYRYKDGKWTPFSFEVGAI